ncbi:MAG TPA: ABC-F family ATP-binding cassette domain-containing protein [Gaiellales bacterium]|nr:ABC-F family ATP-binding cassette domain-containing protein [Gaiellales bacterium]
MLKADSLRAAHDAAPLFDAVSFVLGDGDRIGLVGPNGSGKSTLLRILAGVAKPDGGTVQTDAGDRVGYLAQQPPDPGLTVGEHLAQSAGELYLTDRRLRALEQAMAQGQQKAMDEYGRLQERFAALDGWLFRDTVDEVRRHVGIDHLDDATTLAELSGGQAARVMLAGVLLSRPTVLLLDEPTNHLDLDGIRWLEDWLSRFTGAVLVVTHDRRFLDRTVTSIFELDPVSRGLEHYEGGYTAYREERERRFQRRLEEHRAQERYRKRLEADIASTRDQAQRSERSASGMGADKQKRYAKKVAKKAKAREGRLERQMASTDWLDRPEQAATLSLDLSGSSRPGRRVAALDGVTAGYGAEPVLHDVSLVVSGRQRIAVTGPNGAGKSTLFRLLTGALVPTAGTVEVDARVGVLPQTHDGLPLDRTVLDHYRGGVVGHEHDARAVLGWFLFSQEQLFRPLRTLSAGERSRLLVAMLVMSGAELLLLDEPTNHLDFASIDVIERALDDFRGTIITVSHDREFIRGITCDRLWEVREGRVIERAV